MAKVRDVESLKKEALIFWPEELSDREKKASIIPKLILTQSKFISLLHVADMSPDGWKDILPKTRGLPPNLFLKHLMVLSDLGGEKMKRFKTELANIFDQSIMHFAWGEDAYEYEFKTLGKSGGWDNKRLGVDGKGLAAAKEFNDAIEDVIMLLMHGGACTDPGIPNEILDKCVVGSLLGDKRKLNSFVRQRYIWVSRITGGAAANMLGYLAEEYLREQLQGLLPDWDFSNKTIPGISQTAGRTDMSFDIVAESPDGRFCAIEASFQVTTNSTIERKAGQAGARQALLHNYGHSIAYVIDGAGNFERQSALRTICQHSDFTVTFREREIEKLGKFLQLM